MNSLKIFTATAVTLGVITVALLPIPFANKIFILMALAFCAVFVFVEATGKGKTFAAITIAALMLYLLVTFQRGWLMIAHGGIAGMLLGIGLIVLPIIGAWAMFREIIFGSRVQQMAKELDTAGELPEDHLPRSASGRVDQGAADAEFENFRQQLEAEPQNWKHWFNISTLYSLAGDRSRARKCMRMAIALKRGKTIADMSV